MDLVEVLKSNGTGILKGFARLKTTDSEGIFNSSIKNFDNLNSEYYSEKENKSNMPDFPVSFSIDKNYLGTFIFSPKKLETKPIYLGSPEGEQYLEGMFGTIAGGKVSIQLNIFEIDIVFGITLIFRAELIDKEIILNEIIIKYD